MLITKEKKVRKMGSRRSFLERIRNADQTILLMMIKRLPLSESELIPPDPEKNGSSVRIRVPKTAMRMPRHSFLVSFSFR